MAPFRSKKRKTSTTASGPSRLKGPTKVIEVVPAGDVLLKVGKDEDAVDIKVSGVVLSLASEVFAKMLSSDFVEGQSRVVRLPEDDPATWLTFCKIIHYAAGDIEPQSPDDLIRLGVMADMRLATEALSPWVYMHLTVVIDKLDKLNPDLKFFSKILEAGVRHGRHRFTVDSLFRIALLFGFEDLFWETTGLLILQCFHSESQSPPRLTSGPILLEADAKGNPSVSLLFSLADFDSNHNGIPQKTCSKIC